MKLAPRSIEGRLLTISAVATLVALAIAATLIAGVLGRIVTEGIDRRLDAELALMATAVTRDGVDQARLTTLRGALDAGERWRWRIDGPDGAIGGEDLAIADGPLRPDRDRRRRGDGPRPIEGRDHDGAALHARRLTIATARGPVTLTAAAPRDVIARPVLGALAPLAVTLLLLGGVLTVASIVQIRLGLRPVRRLRTAVAAVRSGARDAVPEDQPDELRPLAAELNALIRDGDAALAGARASAANLAHALKTPVATLALALRDDARADQVAQIDATIRHHLARARAAVAATRIATPLAPALRDLAATIARLTRGRAIGIEIAVGDDVAVAVDPADLDELAGNLIDNAVRHASARVVVSAHAVDRRVVLSVVDDGPGIPAADRARATAPGVRLDERGDGHGFGLAIVRDLAELHGGALTLDDAAGGGLVARVSLPQAGGA